MKKSILVSLCIIVFLLVGAAPQLYADEDEKVSRLTMEEITYFQSLDKAYTTANGYISEMESMVISWVASSSEEVVVDIASYHAKFANLAPSFRQPPPSSMQALSTPNKAVADKLTNGLSPCLGLVGEEGVNQAVDWFKGFVGTKPKKKDGPSIQTRVLSCATEQIGGIKASLAGGQGALYALIQEIEQERFEKELGAAALEEELFGEGEWCFIATAAYGTPATEEIDVLRKFRDEFLLQNAPGRVFVGIYYATSPPMADFISEHELLRTVVRECFVDVVVWVVDRSQSWWAR